MSDGRLDDAARAGWLYYVARRTQDEIAREMGVSRQKAQRLVSLAASEGLVKVRLEHPVARCMELAGALSERWGLDVARVCPSDPDAPALLAGVASLAAMEMERALLREAPCIMALGTGRALTSAVEQVARMERPQHRVVSLLGNMMTDGSASPFAATVRLAERTGAKHYPMALPVFAASPEEVAMLQAQVPVANTLALCADADVVFVGVGPIGRDGPMVADGFVSEAEMATIVAAGAAGEITGWVFDADGAILPLPINDRVTAAALQPSPTRPVVGIANGPAKVRSIAAALTGRLINGLITDEATAAALLDL